MDERQLLQLRIENLAQELSRAESGLDAKPIDPALRERVRGRFNVFFNKKRLDLQTLRSMVAKSLPLDQCWATLADISGDSSDLFREFLALLQGAVVRSSGLDDGLCRIADAMLDNVSHRTEVAWGRITILAEGEFYYPMAAIIRLRFPEVSLWNLPVAAHEFGHYVAQELKVQGPGGGFVFPFKRLLDQEQPAARPFLHEFFADILATYTIGPSLAATCVLLRFDPAAAYRDGQEHPSAAKRLYVMFRTLRKMDEAEGGLLTKPYQAITNYLEQVWQQNVAAASSGGQLDAPTCLELDDWQDRIYQLLASELPGDARYNGWRRAEQQAEVLRPSLAGGAVLAAAPGDSIADVLNAAWLCRLQYSGEDASNLRDIGRGARALCQQIANLG